MYIIIKQDANNKNVYTKLSTKVVSMSSGDDITTKLQRNEYFYSTMPSTLKKKSFILRKAEKSNTQMDIEYFNSNPNSKITLNNYADTIDYEKNTTTIEKETYANGRYLISVRMQASQTDTIVLTIFNTVNNLRYLEETKESVYMIKYKTSTGVIKHFTLHDTIEITKNTKEFKGTINSTMEITSEEKEIVHSNTLYTINIYPLEENKNVDYYNKLILADTPINTLMIKGNDSAKITFTVPTDVSLDKEYIVVVQANVFDGDNSEHLLYMPVKTAKGKDPDPVEPVTPKQTDWKKIIIIIGCICLGTLLIIGMLCLYRWCKKNSKKGNLEKDYKKIQELNNAELTY